MAFAVFVIILTAAILIIVGLGLGPAGQITAAIVGLIVYFGIAGWLSTLIGKWIFTVMIFGPIVALAVWAFVMVARGKMDWSGNLKENNAARYRRFRKHRTGRHRRLP